MEYIFTSPSNRQLAYVKKIQSCTLTWQLFPCFFIFSKVTRKQKQTHACSTIHKHPHIHESDVK